jgi:hypothetical protein
MSAALALGRISLFRRGVLARPRTEMAAAAAWRPLEGVTPEELTLEHTLPTGQTFR